MYGTVRITTLNGTIFFMEHIWIASLILCAIGEGIGNMHRTDSWKCYASPCTENPTKLTQLKTTVRGKIIYFIHITSF